MKRRAAFVATFLLGVVLTLAAGWLRSHLPARDDAPVPVVVIPALASETFTYRWADGFTALLFTADGQRLELPLMWLPGDAEPGDSFLVTTQVRPEDDLTSFEVVVEPGG